MTVQLLATALLAKGWQLAVAESCTGGMIAAACTDLAGSSSWFDCGFVTYSNAAKTQMLGVPESLLAQFGAVSEPVAAAMAQGALQRSRAHIAASVTGIAGPGGATAGKPVGTVCFGFATEGGVHTVTMHFKGDRAAVRLQAVDYALATLLGLSTSRVFINGAYPPASRRATKL
jgi:nicotinamide-nucleotide amidase